MTKFTITKEKNMNLLKSVRSEASAAQKASNEAERTALISRTIVRIQRKAETGQRYIYMPEHWGKGSTRMAFIRKYFKKEGFQIVEEENGFRIHW